MRASTYMISVTEHDVRYTVAYISDKYVAEKTVEALEKRKSRGPFSIQTMSHTQIDVTGECSFSMSEAGFLYLHSYEYFDFVNFDYEIVAVTQDNVLSIALYRALCRLSNDIDPAVKTIYSFSGNHIPVHKVVVSMQGNYSGEYIMQMIEEMR